MKEYTVNCLNTEEQITNSELQNVLIVEDNAELRSFLSESLQGVYNISQAKNGFEGYNKAINLMPDIIISDVMMPVMDGYELCHKLKSNFDTSHIPIILLTAKTSYDDRLLGFEEGADAYMSKPFEVDVLKAQIKSIITSRKMLWRNFESRHKDSLNDALLTDKDRNFINEITNKIEVYMADHTLTVDWLASEFGMTKFILNKKIKALTGTTPKNFIRTIRLKRAASLLKSGNYHVADVTYEVGFSDLRHFRENFKEEFGLTPSEYKKSVFK